MVPYFLLPAVSTQILQTFDCETIEWPSEMHLSRSRRYLVADYGIRCQGPRYRLYSIYAAFAVFAWPVGIPCLYFVMLRATLSRVLQWYLNSGGFERSRMCQGSAFALRDLEEMMITEGIQTI